MAFPIVPFLTAIASLASASATANRPLPQSAANAPTGPMQNPGPIANMGSMTVSGSPLQGPGAVPKIEDPELETDLLKASPDLMPKEKSKEEDSMKDFMEILSAAGAAMQVAGPLLGMNPDQRQIPAPIPGGPAGGAPMMMGPPRTQSIGELLAGLRVR